MKTLFVCALALVAAPGWSQDQPKLTARELFYQPVAARQKPAAQPARSRGQKPAQITPAAKPAHAVEGTPAKPADAVATPRPARPPAAEPSEFVNVAYSPLGLRYSVLKKTDSALEEVDADSTFHSGDRIRLSIEANGNGYLYVINRGSSGSWKVLFPSAEVDGGSNSIAQGRRYDIPNGFWFTFDEQAGEEKLFIVLSRRPEPDLEGIIYSLSRPAAQPSAEPGHPAVQPSAEPARPASQERMLMASNISDSTVGRLRNFYARDLIVEKVSEQSAATPAAPREKATYVVNPQGSADSRVVADIMLRHR